MLVLHLTEDAAGISHFADLAVPLDADAFAATDDRDEVSFPIEGFDLGSLSMRAVRWG